MIGSASRPHCRRVFLLIASDFFLRNGFCLCNVCSVSALWYLLHVLAVLRSAISVTPIFTALSQM